MDMMDMAKHELTPQDLMPIDQYGRERRDHGRRVAALKKHRRMEVGPDVTFYFENYDTMWFQVHEMLHIEKGGAAQIPDELGAYNPLIPKGRELVATMMIEIDDPVRRARVLGELGGIEETVTLSVGGETVRAVAEEDVDRTSAAGKASSVQFIHFPFTDAQVAAFRKSDADVIVAIGHPRYRHMAGMPEQIRAALSEDFD
jgi:hypothetical protein